MVQYPVIVIALLALCRAFFYQTYQSCSQANCRNSGLINSSLSEQIFCCVKLLFVTLLSSSVHHSCKLFNNCFQVFTEYSLPACSWTLGGTRMGSIWVPPETMDGSYMVSIQACRQGRYKRQKLASEDPRQPITECEDSEVSSGLGNNQVTLCNRLMQSTDTQLPEIRQSTACNGSYA